MTIVAGLRYHAGSVLLIETADWPVGEPTWRAAHSLVESLTMPAISAASVPGRNVYQIEWSSANTASARR